MLEKNSLFAEAERCLRADDIARKIDLSHACAAAWENGALSLYDDGTILRIEAPGRPATPRLVEIQDLPRRNPGTLKGHISLMHAIAHIEFNAVDLAWDAVYRFRQMPQAFYNDWVRVAREEAYHFTLINDYLHTLGANYGDMDAHNGLWEMAKCTDHDPLVRMALVPRVLEARGLDVTPGIIEKLRQYGYEQAADIMHKIYTDEIGHVEIGSRWYHYLCQQQMLEPESHFHALVKQYAFGKLRKPINDGARLRAGFSTAEIDYLYRSL